MAETITFTGKIARVDILPEPTKVTFEINNNNVLVQLCDTRARGDLLTIEIKPYRKKRSLNANAYAWKLITEIANVLRASKEEIYLQMLRRYGQSEIISLPPTVPIGDYVKYYEKLGYYTINGEINQMYRVYKGSSEFNSYEMAILIDGIVSEAKELGIQTETPEEIARIKSLWKEE